MKKIASILILIIIILSSCTKKEENNWKNKSELIGNWIKLERDKKGYLIYDPCDGNTNFINVNNDFVIYSLGHESPDTLKIDEVKILESSNQIEFLATHEFYQIKSIMKFIDSKEKLFLLKWELTPKSNKYDKRKGKMMMTKKRFKNDFRFINNPCDSNKISEKEFLAIEYE